VRGLRGWDRTDAALLVLLGGLAVASMWTVWREVFLFGWRSEEQSHILLAPFVVAWLFWTRRARLRRLRPRRSLLGPAMIAAGLLLAAFGFRFGYDIARHMGAIAVLVGAVVTVAGPMVVWMFLPCFGAMVFLMPVPGRIRAPVAQQLQEHSAAIVHWGLDLFGVPVERAGNLLTINGFDVQVAEACNGMRMVSALALVTYAFVFSTPMRNSVRLLLLAASPLVALLVNIIRLAPTVLFYGYSSPDAADLFHDVSGWAVLLVALAMLWGIVALLRWLEAPIAPYEVAGE